ncbi:MAG TPA: hypothetical protein VIW95_15495 [Candidatus Binatus sp.]|uniref:hypothetical protein n=1 Tax=Candidatus Binatus sp. TaxID=2811406 RepID=UPI002F3F1036
MTAGYMSRLAGALTVVVTIATCTASCSSKQEQPPAMDVGSTQISPAAAGSCKIDAVKMCQATGSSAPAPPQPAMASSYGPPNLPDSIEFQIPAGESIKLMCYYDPQHNSVYRADATPQSPLSGNSVEYMKKQGFCASN